MRRFKRFGTALVLCGFTVAALVVPAADAKVGDVTSFPAPPGLEGSFGWDSMVVGSDDNLWFAVCHPDLIGRVNPDGEMTFFDDPTGEMDCPSSLTLASDGNVWFRSDELIVGGRIGHVTPSGEVTTLPQSDPVDEIVAGPDGNLWFDQGNDMIRMTPEGEVVAQFPFPPLWHSFTAGSDGRVWAVGSCNPSGPAFVAIPENGAFETYCSPSVSPHELATGDTGRLLFTSATAVGSLDPAAADPVSTIQTVSTTGRCNSSSEVTSGPDGLVWFLCNNNRLTRVSTDGTLSDFPVDNDPIGLVRSVVSSPDGSIWYTANDADSRGVGRLRVLNEACNTAPPPSQYPDVSDAAWFHASLDWADCHGFASPIQGEFRPDRPARRGRLVHMLWTMVDLPGQWASALPSPNPHGYPDVQPHKWFNDALDWAVAEGMVTELPDGEFHQRREVRRREFYFMLWNMVGRPPAATVSGFTDVPKGSWYEDAVDWASERELVLPTGSQLHPERAMKRSQVVAILDRLAHNESAWSAWTDADVTTWRF